LRGAVSQGDGTNYGFFTKTRKNTPKPKIGTNPRHQQKTMGVVTEGPNHKGIGFRMGGYRAVRKG